MMIDFVASLKDRYAEETGWSFSFFEVASFSLYLFFGKFLFGTGATGVWSQLIEMRFQDLVLGNSSMFLNANVLEYFVSFMSLLLTVLIYRKLQSKVYDYLSTLKDMDHYIKKLKNKYKKVEESSQEVRIYMAKEAARDKNKYMRQVSTLSGLGFVSISGFIATIPFFLQLGLVDILSAVICLFIFFAAQWSAFVKYTSQVLPRLVLEKQARGEPIEFGEELEK